MDTFRIADAARLLGVSDDTVRRWVDHGTLPTTGDTPARISGDALAARAVELAHAAKDPTDVLSSARNRFVGIERLDEERLHEICATLPPKE